MRSMQKMDLLNEIMGHEIKKKIRWNFILAGTLMLVINFYVTNFSYIFDWSNAELIGFNTWALFTTGICIFIIYRGFRY